MTDDEVLKAVCAGSTSKPHRLRVLYNDGSRFLVKYPGAYDGRCIREWIHGWVDLYETPVVRGGWGWQGKSVWDNHDSGRLTRNRLLELVVKLGLDPSHARNT